MINRVLLPCLNHLGVVVETLARLIAAFVSI